MVLFVIKWGFSPKIITNEVCNTMFLLFLLFLEDLAKIVQNKLSCSGIFRIGNIGFFIWSLERLKQGTTNFLNIS